MSRIRSTTFPGGESVPVLGQGTWRMGEDPSKRKNEIAALRTGIELGMSLIDTAEMYANGGAERVVGEAIAGKRHRPVMAYSPVEEGLLTHPHPVLKGVAERHDATPAQVALAWVIRDDGVIAIPKAADPKHVRENRGAADIKLTKRDLDELDESFPAPEGRKPLESR